MYISQPHPCKWQETSVHKKAAPFSFLSKTPYTLGALIQIQKEQNPWQKGSVPGQMDTIRPVQWLPGLLEFQLGAPAVQYCKKGCSEPWNLNLIKYHLQDCPMHTNHLLLPLINSESSSFLSFILPDNFSEKSVAPKVLFQLSLRFQDWKKHSKAPSTWQHLNTMRKWPHPRMPDTGDGADHQAGPGY